MIDATNLYKWHSKSVNLTDQDDTIDRWQVFGTMIIRDIQTQQLQIINEQPPIPRYVFNLLAPVLSSH